MRTVSLGILLGLIVILGITFFHVLAPFLMPLFLAGVFAILCQPLYRHFTVQCKGRHRLAAGATTGTVMAIILIPLITATIFASLQLFVLASDFSARDWRNRLDHVGESARHRTESIVDWASGFVHRQLPPDAQRTPEDVERIIQLRLREFMTSLGGRSLGVAGQTIGGTFDLLSGSVLTVFSFLLSFLIFAVALYYFLADGVELLAAAETLVPVHVKYQRELMNQFAKVVRSVVSATFLAALAQGVATAAALWLFGFPQLIILFLLSVMAALIPLIGTWLVWGPCAVWLFWTGHWFQGTLLVIYGSVFVGLLDNVVRTYVLKNDTKLHPLLAFISVLGGLQTMGLWGMFIGPIVASCLHALVKIFNHELRAFSQERISDVELGQVLADEPLTLPSPGEPSHTKPQPPNPETTGAPDSDLRDEDESPAKRSKERPSVTRTTAKASGSGRSGRGSRSTRKRR